MEDVLLGWINKMDMKGAPISSTMLRAKARAIYQMLMKEDSSIEGQHFTASKGWFENFKKRHSICSLKFHGEAASADTDAAEKFKLEYEVKVIAGRYSQDQQYNMDETGLTWKQMPGRTFVSRQKKMKRGRKIAKQRITIVFCSNLPGSHMLKPLIIHTSLRPRAFRKKSTSPEKEGFHWCANRKAWMTKERFSIWFNEIFVPETRAHMKQLNQAFNVLLLFDNAPGHPKELTHPNVGVVYLPPNVTSLIQPLDQGIIAAFKKAYIRYSMGHIIEEMERLDLNRAGSDSGSTNSDSDNDTTQTDTVAVAWKNYDIVDCLVNIRTAMSDLTPAILRN